MVPVTIFKIHRMRSYCGPVINLFDGGSPQNAKLDLVKINPVDIWREPVTTFGEFLAIVG